MSANPNIIGNPSLEPVSSLPLFSSHPVILVVDDEDIAHQRVRLICKSANTRFEIVSAKTIEEAEVVLNSRKIHAMVLDRDLGRSHSDETINGIDYIADFLNAQPHLQILVVTGNNQISEVVRAMESGALNFIVKDTADALIVAQIEKAISQAQIKLREIQFERSLDKSDSNFSGKSRAFRSLKNRLKAVAEADRPLLLLGESGTGKTTAAKYVHDLRSKSRNLKNAPFYSLNMANLSPNLADRELFGNERGAYTDAKEAKAGIVELADGGTLFLDEIGETNLETQAKLLKVLEEGTYMRLGGQRERKSSFKLICATNRNLEEMVVAGKFREDLYMRISAFTEKMPRLADRSDDIPDLIRVLLPKISTSLNLNVRFEDLPKEFVRYLQSHPIPGNIRGLDHYLVRLLTLSPRPKGKPIFSNWKRLLFPRVRNISETVSTEIKIPFDLNSSAFPNFKDLSQNFENSLMLRMSEKFLRTEDIAKALKISRATAHRLLQRIGHSDRQKILAKDRMEAGRG